jgi:hypothetical protein
MSLWREENVQLWSPYNPEVIYFFAYQWEI